MRFVTARVGPNTQLQVESGTGFVPVTGLNDVGELLRASESGFAAARRAIAGATSGVSIDELDLGPPVLNPRAIVCVGRNYAEHAREGGDEVPTIPIIFSKYANALVGSGEPVIRHAITEQLDYEGELCVVIGRRAHRIDEDEAMEYVAGYTIMNDISARDLQLGDVQWIRGKSLDTFGPTGPAFVTADEAGAVHDLRIETRVNGEVRQDASCGDMVYKIPTLLSFITQAITLEPGDLVPTGTPAGTGFGSTPGRYLNPGDIVEVSITGLGTLRNPIVAGA